MSKFSVGILYKQIFIIHILSMATFSCRNGTKESNQIHASRLEVDENRNKQKKLQKFRRRAEVKLFAIDLVVSKIKMLGCYDDMDDQFHTILNIMSLVQIYKYLRQY